MQSLGTLFNLPIRESRVSRNFSQVPLHRWRLPLAQSGIGVLVNKLLNVLPVPGPRPLRNTLLFELLQVFVPKMGDKILYRRGGAVSMARVS